MYEYIRFGTYVALDKFSQTFDRSPPSFTVDQKRTILTGFSNPVAFMSPSFRAAAVHLKSTQTFGLFYFCHCTMMNKVMYRKRR